MASSPTLVDARQHADAVKAALDATLNNQAFDYDEARGLNSNTGAQPHIYALVSVERRAGESTRAVAATGRTGWRVAVRCVGRTVDECRWAMYHAALALNEKCLTVGGLATTPLQFESDQAPAFDEGRYSGLALYTFVH